MAARVHAGNHADNGLHEGPGMLAAIWFCLTLLLKVWAWSGCLPCCCSCPSHCSCAQPGPEFVPLHGGLQVGWSKCDV